MLQVDMQANFRSLVVGCCSFQGIPQTVLVGAGACTAICTEQETHGNHADVQLAYAVDVLACCRAA